MDALHASAETVVDWLLEVSWQAGVLVVLVAAAQLVFRRWLTPRWRYALWGLVLVRLCLPVLPPSPVSVFNLDAPRVARAETDVSPGPPADAPAEATTRVARPAETATADKPRAATNTRERAAAAPVVLAPPPAPLPPPPPAPWPWQTPVALLWLSVALVLALWTVVRQIRFARRVAREPVVGDGPDRRLLETCAREAGVRRTPVLVRTALVETPALTGVLRPRLLVPARVLDEMDDDERRFVFRHELAHLRSGDVLLNWVLAAAQAAHWFNPLVWVAFARLRSHRESARDWMALAGESPAGRQHYGRTLIRLLETGSAKGSRPAVVGILEGREDMRRRITMIARFQGNPRQGLLFGVFVATLLGGLALTGASLDEARAQDPQPSAGLAAPRPSPQLRQVRVERRQAVPAWKTAIRTRLRKPMSVNFKGAQVAEFVAHVRQVAGVNIVMRPETAEEVAHEAIDLTVNDVAAADVLQLGLRLVDLDYALADEVVFVGPIGELPMSIEQRFYDIRDLTAAMDEYDGPADAAESVITLVQTFAGGDAWAEEGVSIAYWKGLLVVHQTDAIHRRTEAFLNLLLNRGERPAATVPHWKRNLRRALGKRVSVNFHEMTVADAVAYLARIAETTIVVRDEEAGEREVSLEMSDVAVEKVLEWLARFTRTNLAYENGVAVLTSRPLLTVELYEVGDIVRARTDPEEDGGSADEIFELIHYSVDPASWEDYGPAMEYWDDMLVVRQKDTVHAGIRGLLATLRRALRD